MWRVELRLGDPALPYALVADGVGASQGSATAGQTTMTVICDGLRQAATVTPVLLRQIVATARQAVQHRRQGGR